MTKAEPSETKTKRPCPFKKAKWPFLAGFIFAILAFIGLNAAMAPVSKSEYCGSKCHEMNTAYQTWELSPHGANSHGVRIECVDCHLVPKDNYFKHVAIKGYLGAKDTYKHYFGPEYDLEVMRKEVQEKMSNETCLHCHKDLLVAFSSPAAQAAHNGLMNHPDAEHNRCVHCHENAGHERESKLFE